MYYRIYTPGDRDSCYIHFTGKKWGLRLRNLSKVTKQVRGRGWAQAQVCGTISQSVAHHGPSAGQGPLPGKQDSFLLPGPGGSPNPLLRVRDLASQGKIWVGREGQSVEGWGLGKELWERRGLPPISGTQRPGHGEGLCWALSPQLRTLLLPPLDGSGGGEKGEGHLGRPWVTWLTWDHQPEGFWAGPGWECPQTPLVNPLPNQRCS